ncbi:MAG: DUF4858 domain-containing protein [Prevotellaceae bacterium]|jgi:hypothetical protein|nr:DUF4858 domain-containing protein [Prevotellaceae bacterium]
MNRLFSFIGLLTLAVLPVCAQQGVERDSLRNLLPKTTELKPNLLFSPDKKWLDFDLTLPTEPAAKKSKQPERKLTLHPYTINTPYNWDPFRQRKIEPWEDAWHKKIIRPYTNPKPDNNTPPDERAVKLPYLPGSVHGVGATVYSGDLLWVFTKDFWSFQKRKNRERAKAVLNAYDLDTIPSMPSTP